MKKTGFSHLLFPSVMALLLSTLLMIGAPSAALSAAADESSTDQTVSAVPSTEGETTPDIPEGTDPTPAENTVLLSNITSLRAGNEVTFSFSANGEGIRALQGSITYDKTVLTYKGITDVNNDWLFTLSDADESTAEGSGKLSYLGLTTQTGGTSGVQTLFSITFLLSADTVAGNTIPFHLANATALKGDTEVTFTGGAATFTIDRQISDDSTLTALTVATGTLAPTFDPSVTEYRLQVPYNCESLELTATPAPYAAVEISDRALAVGNNDITVTVTSESGTQTVYTLTVTRLSDPNYVPSSDSLLTGISLSDGMLFPAFSPSITEYTVYAVNDGVITLTPTPAEFGSAETVTLESSEGASCTLTSTAEDGSTTVYTFTVLRVSTPEQGGQSGQAQTGAATGSPIGTALFIALLSVVAVTLFFVGFGISRLIEKKK